MEDVRRFRRKEVSFTVLYRVNSPLDVHMRVGNREFDAEALDLSEEGMAVLTKYKNYAIPFSAVVALKFVLPDKSIEIKGEVASSLFMKEKGAYRLGIHFIDISDDERKFIADFVR